MYAIKLIKICAEYRDMLPRPQLDLSGTPGLRPVFCTDLNVYNICIYMYIYVYIYIYLAFSYSRIHSDMMIFIGLKICYLRLS